jgi:hypothetical protein
VVDGLDRRSRRHARYVPPSFTRRTAARGPARRNGGRSNGIGPAAAGPGYPTSSKPTCRHPGLGRTFGSKRPLLHRRRSRPSNTFRRRTVRSAGVARTRQRTARSARSSETRSREHRSLPKTAARRPASHPITRRRRRTRRRAVFRTSTHRSNEVPAREESRSRVHA